MEKGGIYAKRYIVYDKKTGDIVHTHQVYKFGSDILEKVDDKEIMEIASRLTESKNLKAFVTDEPYVSSKEFKRMVDVKTEKIITTAIHPRRE